MITKLFQSNFRSGQNCGLQDRLCRASEKVLCAEPLRRPCIPSLRGASEEALMLRRGPLCRVQQEVLYTEPEGRPSTICAKSQRRSSCCEEAHCAEPKRRPSNLHVEPK